jgi:pimeloyl-ACP methyl ester carboxylesterase
LHAWFVKTAAGSNYKTAPTIVFFHANAGNMGLRLPNVDALVHLDANVLIFDYRGYGNSDDVPINEEGLKLDGAAVMRYIDNREDIDRSKIFLFGRSLGGAVAVHTATAFSHAIAGIILENTFTSISDMVRTRLGLSGNNIAGNNHARCRWIMCFLYCQK